MGILICNVVKWSETQSWYNPLLICSKWWHICGSFPNRVDICFQWQHTFPIIYNDLLLFMNASILGCILLCMVIIIFCASLHNTIGRFRESINNMIMLWRQNASLFIYLLSLLWLPFALYHGAVLFSSFLIIHSMVKVIVVIVMHHQASHIKLTVNQNEFYHLSYWTC